MEAFVRCAAEYLADRGALEAGRAFREDGRWRHGPLYVFVDRLGSAGETPLVYVFPPDPSRENRPWTEPIGAFGTDYFEELRRILSVVDSGWIYYSFRNPVTGRDEPKSSYLMKVMWDGVPAVIGAGLYWNDVPGACSPEAVSAASVTVEPSHRRLQELARCAGWMVQEQGYFAKHALESDSRWSDGWTRVFAVDTMGNQLLSSDPIRVNGYARHEWRRAPGLPHAFDGRDVAAIGDAFGESFLYYMGAAPSGGSFSRKVAALKRIAVQGIPVLVGASHYLADGRTPAAPACSENLIAAGAVRSRRDIQALVTCAAEYVELHGPDEAYRSYHEDARWAHREHYVFVRLLDQGEEPSQLVAFPPDRSREGIPGASLHNLSADIFGDYLRELHRIAESFDEGWVHYYFVHPETGTVEPKSSYITVVDWNGRRAVVAAGIWEQDLPATCHPSQVSAARVAANPSEAALREFVRCAAARVEALGLFAGPVLQSDQRWSSGATSVIAVNAETGEIQFSRNPQARPFAEFVASAFDGRDVISMTQAFGEAFWYYRQSDDAAAKVAFVKRVMAHDVPLLVGADYELPSESGSP